MTPKPYITILDFDLESNKYATPETKEIYAENYLENGEFSDSITHIEVGKKTMVVRSMLRKEGELF